MLNIFVRGGSVVVTGCLSRGRRVLPGPGGECGAARAVRQSSEGGMSGNTVYEQVTSVRHPHRVEVFRIDNLILPPSLGQVVVQYPPPGTWHLALAASCGQPTGSCSAPVIFSVHTNHCFSGGCGKYGRCHAYLSPDSGLLYSGEERGITYQCSLSLRTISILSTPLTSVFVPGWPPRPRLQ